MSDKRKAWDLCQHDEYLPQLVRDAGMQGGVVGIEVEANGQRADWGEVPDGRANWERHKRANGDPRDGEAWQRFEQRLREAGL